MLFPALQRVAAATLIVMACALPSLAEDGPVTSTTKHILDVNRGEKFATARIRMSATDLRELIYRLLDEDGFRVERFAGSIPREGQTLKGKKHLRRVECEIVPDTDPTVTALSFEYSRFGNRAWSERALNMVIADITKHEPPDVPTRAVTAAPAPAPASPTPTQEAAAFDAPESTSKPAIPSVDYFNPTFAHDKYETSMPIPPLSIQPLAPPPDRNAAPATPAPETAKPPAAEVAVPGMTAEVVILPGQKNARTSNPGEEIFRAVQRGDVTPEVGEEKIRVFLEVYWLDASQAPTADQRKTLAHKLAQSLAQRQIGSRGAGDIVNLIDTAVRPADVKEQARRLLLEKLVGILDAAETDAQERAMWTDEVESVIAQKK